jgi:predicted ATPase
MTTAVLEAGAERGREIAGSVPAIGLGVPATLQTSLMARLDRLGPAAKAVAQIGAAIGREFSYELAASVGEPSEERLRDALRSLVEAGLVFQRGEPPTAEYLFKHALVQEAAYGTLLRRTRQQLHARIAAALEERFPDRVVREPEALARHFYEAQHPDRALGYWLEAGRRATERSANLEAIGHLTRALEALELLPLGAERDRQELTIQTAIGTPLIAVHGYAGAETGLAFNRHAFLANGLETRAPCSQRSAASGCFISCAAIIK